MKPSGFQWLAASSLLLATFVAHAETRPLYGGTLHISVRESPTTLDPADTTQPDSFARRNLTPLMFETLIVTDEFGRMKPELATSWRSDTIGQIQNWRFRLRKSVLLHDGTALTPASAAVSLRIANPSWKITSDADSLAVECDAPCSHLPEELALARNAIVKKSDDGKSIGTGPFHISDWQPGKKLTLAAEENYWAGRPYFDAIEIEFGKSYREQLVSQELGKADLIEISPEQSHRLPMASHKVSISEPTELVALIFARDARSPEEKSLREALALCVDRASIGSVILQGSGQSAASILPNWMSGYAFEFSTEPDLARARHLRSDARAAPSWTISYDATDLLAGVLADRVALNARDAGLQLQTTKSAGADIRVVRIPLPSNSINALSFVATSAALSAPHIKGDAAEDIYSIERELLTTLKMIPLFHLPVVYATSPALKGWSMRADGSWNLADVWLSREPYGGITP